MPAACGGAARHAAKAKQPAEGARLDHSDGQQLDPQREWFEHHRGGEDPEITGIADSGECPERLVMVVVDRLGRVAVVFGIAEEIKRVGDVSAQRKVSETGTPAPSAQPGLGEFMRGCLADIESSAARFPRVQRWALSSTRTALHRLLTCQGAPGEPLTGSDSKSA